MEFGKRLKAFYLAWLCELLSTLVPDSHTCVRAWIVWFDYAIEHGMEIVEGEGIHEFTLSFLKGSGNIQEELTNHEVLQGKLVTWMRGNPFLKELFLSRLASAYCLSSGRLPDWQEKALRQLGEFPPRCYVDNPIMSPKDEESAVCAWWDV